jgi:CBS-domain-containing membrane protein
MINLPKWKSFKADRSVDRRKGYAMKIKNCMKKKVHSVQTGATVADALRMLMHHNIGTLPVLDLQGHLIGLILLRDLINLVMPDFVDLLENIRFVHDFGAVEKRNIRVEDLERKVDEIMGAPISAQADFSLLHGAAILRQNNLIDLPIVDADNHLCGIVSQVDLGIAMMRDWVGEWDPVGNKS